MVEKVIGSQLLQSTPREVRSSIYKINPIILNRWSPRSMTGEELQNDELMSLFEAARWAPSSANSQPWRFIYATRDTEEWNTLFNLLVDLNKIWAKNAAVLIVIVSKKEFEYKGKVIASATHQFDTGAACEADNFCTAKTAPARISTARVTPAPMNMPLEKRLRLARGLAEIGGAFGFD